MGPRGGHGERRLHAADPQLPLLKDYVNGGVPRLSTMSTHIWVVSRLKDMNAKARSWQQITIRGPAPEYAAF